MKSTKGILTEWLVVARSSNTNGFGLRQYVLVNRQGDAYKALHHEVFSVHSVCKAYGADFTRLGFECVEQISEKMPAQALSDAWALAGEPEPTAKGAFCATAGSAERKFAVKAPGVDEIMQYENGEMDEETLIDFFQRLIDSKLAWQLQGCYGRQAARLIEAGVCHK